MINGQTGRSALSIAVTMALATGAHAATIQVSNASGGCTLAQAISAANSDSPVGQCATGSGADVILLPELAHYPNFFSEPPPRITSDLTIRGHALGTSDIHCEGGGQPIFIGDENSAPTVTLEGFAISFCQFSAGAGAFGAGGAAGMGGAVFVYDGDVTLKSMLIRNAAASGAAGGSIIDSGAGGGGGGGLRGTGADAGVASASLLTLGSGGGGGANASNGSVVPGGSAGAPNGGAGGNGGIVASPPGDGGFGGGGGGGASLIGIQGGQSGADAGFGGGGGGGATTDGGIAAVGSSAGNGGDGGFGGGGGRGGSSLYGFAANGGAGGFGGGGGSGGSSEQGATQIGASGFGAGPAISNFKGGQGAAFGGAMFVRAGVVTITSSSFTSNSASTSAAVSLGGAIFVLDQSAQDFHNGIAGASRQGMPVVLPVVTGCSVGFTGNTAAAQTGTDTNNHDVYGTSRATLVEPCKDIFKDGFE